MEGAVQIISASATNFASYKKLDFDFQDQGLALLQGATGAGKSTLCDLVPWILFGKTAKGGAVDEILTWPGDEITSGQLRLVVNGIEFFVTRIRGKAKDNDLYFTGSCVDERWFRGKDLTDTQRLLNQRLGFDYDLYLAGAYYHEFSQTAQFFITAAKNRRAICEQLVDLNLPKKLQARLLDEYKKVNKHKDTFTKQSQQLVTAIDTLRRVQASENNKSATWEESHARTKLYVASLYEKFETGRIKTAFKRCNSCGSVLEKPHTHIDESTNPHLGRLAELELEVNPYSGSVKDYSDEITEKQESLARINSDLAFYATELADIELLQQVTADYRSVSILNTIKDIETNTNKLLTNHFDAEIRVQFDAADADKLNVSIQKDGNEASYTQLSKGQRCMLKLCFGISVMQAVQNHHGINFSQLFFDEALDGLSDTLKMKAVHMFETIRQVESIFIVEHSEALKAMITNQYVVTLTHEGSQIEKA